MCNQQSGGAAEHLSASTLRRFGLMPECNALGATASRILAEHEKSSDLILTKSLRSAYKPPLAAAFPRLRLFSEGAIVFRRTL